MRLALVALALVLTACGASDGSEEAAVEDAATGGGLGGSGLAAPAAQGEDGSGDARTVASALPPVSDAAFDEKIIKQGSVAIEVGEGEFGDAASAVVAAAQRLGGGLLSWASEEEDGREAGQVVVRVPVEAYDDLLSDVGAIGTVRSRDITSKDVTTQYIDLRSRLRHAEAQERFYLGLLDDADSVEDAVLVQQHLDDVQAEIERLQGRLQYLDDRTSFSTLTVQIAEPGAAPVTLSAEDASWGRYWEAATDAFVRVVGLLLVTSFGLAPLLALLLAAFAVWRLWRPRPGTAE